MHHSLSLLVLNSAEHVTKRNTRRKNEEAEKAKAEAEAAAAEAKRNKERMGIPRKHAEEAKALDE